MQITIIGLGQIGTSMGLALGAQEIPVLRVGHDHQPAHAREVHKMGAVDRVHLNLPAAVREADVVLIALPLNQIRETMQLIAADLKENVLVMDTAPIKAPIAVWAHEHLPDSAHYIGLIPLLNAAYLLDDEVSRESARADLFHEGLIALVAPSGTQSETINRALHVIKMLGGSPLFADALEADSLLAATHLLPQLVAVALVNAVVDQPGWLEARRFAARAFAHATHPIGLLDRPGALSDAALANQENVVRVLDNLIGNLQVLRSSIAGGDADALLENLKGARDKRARWWQERQAADWESVKNPETELPKASEFITQLLFGRLGRRDPNNE